MKLSRQNEAVLNALKAGPKTSWQLQQLGICCHTKRISELRKRYVITTTEKRTERNRIITYTLEGQRDQGSALSLIEINDHKPHKTFKGASTKGLLGPGVYGWRRGKKYLYIGMSKSLFRRIGFHDVVGRREEFQDSDSLDFWFCSSLNEAAKLEAILIEKHSPIYNGYRPPVQVNAERLCANGDTPALVVQCVECGQYVERKPRARPPQNGELAFCTDAHRARYHRKHPRTGFLFPTEATA